MHGHELLEGLAAVALISSGLVLVPAAWAARRRPAAGHRSTVDPVWARPVRSALRLQASAAAALLIGAAVVHFAVAPEHLADYPPFGVAFLVLGSLQLATAIAVATMGVAKLRLLATVLTLGILSVWAWSRTIGLPIGPDPWIPEPIGVTDSIAAILEAALILVLLVPIERLVTEVHRIRMVDAMSVAIVPVIGSVGLATLVAIASMVPAVHH